MIPRFPSPAPNIMYIKISHRQPRYPGTQAQVPRFAHQNADCVCLSTGASREAPVDNECFSRRQQEILIYRSWGAGLSNLGTWAWIHGYLGWRWELLIYMLLGDGLGNLGITLIVDGRLARGARRQ